MLANITSQILVPFCCQQLIQNGSCPSIAACWKNEIQSAKKPQQILAFSIIVDQYEPQPLAMAPNLLKPYLLH